jgi:hypothetical protein
LKAGTKFKPKALNRTILLKMKKSTVTLLVFFCVAFTGLSLFNSCKSEDPTVANITVQDTLGRALGGAAVTLWQDTTLDPSTATPSQIASVSAERKWNRQTDAGGVAVFDFPAPGNLERYLNVYASKGSQSGRAFVRVEVDKTVSQTVVIR